MSHGGSRSGSGRKPAPPVVLGMDGKRRKAALPPAVTPEERQTLLEPPADLWAPAQVFWRAWAPHAVAERTLTPATAAGFRELCMRMAYVAALDARIGKVGIADALPTLKVRSLLSGQSSSGLKDFKLSAFGKPVTSERPPPTRSPWADICQS